MNKKIVIYENYHGIIKILNIISFENFNTYKKLLKQYIIEKINKCLENQLCLHIFEISDLIVNDKKMYISFRIRLKNNKVTKKDLFEVYYQILECDNFEINLTDEVQIK